MDLRQRLANATGRASESDVEECITALNELGDAESLMLAAKGQAWLLNRRGDFVGARGHAEQAYQFAIELGSPIDEVMALKSLGLNTMMLGDLPRASEYYLRALSRAAEHGLDRWVGNLNSNLANLYAELGDHDRCLQHAHKAIEVYERLGLHNDAAQTSGNLGHVYFMRHDIVRAAELYTQALDVHRAEGDIEGVAHTAISLADVHVMAGDPVTARRFIDEALAVEGLEASILISRYYSHGEVLRLEGDPAAASAEYHKGLALAQEIGFKAAIGGGHEHLMKLALATGDLKVYVEHSQAYHAIDKELRGQDAARRIADLEQRSEQERRDEEIRRQRAVLNSMLPSHVADRVARGETVNDSHADAAVIFADIVRFTDHAAGMDPSDVVALLHTVFSTIDAIVAREGLQKIKTIGDSYMAVALNDAEGADVCLRAGACALSILAQRFTWPNGEPLTLRIGMHCGPVTAGVIGTDRLQYDVWGDTVNVASRMESTGRAGSIHITAHVASRLRRADDTDVLLLADAQLVARGAVEVKGKGTMESYWLEPPVPGTL